MSRNRTVACKYCYEEGHNRRGCPSRKSRVEDLIRRGECNNFFVIEQRDYDSAVSSRKCSYCGKTDHNVRTCPHPTRDWEYLANADALWRSRLVKSYKEKYPGLGTGAIVSQTDVAYDWEEDRYVPFKIIYRVDSARPMHLHTILDQGGHMYDSFLRGHVVSCSPQPGEHWQWKSTGRVSAMLTPDIAGLTPRYKTFDNCGAATTNYPNLGKMGDIQILSPASHKAVDFMWEANANHKLGIEDLLSLGTTIDHDIPARDHFVSKGWKLELRRLIGRANVIFSPASNNDNPWRYLVEDLGLPAQR